MTDLIDKVTRGLGKGVITVGVKCSEAFQSASLRDQITEILPQRQAALESLGSLVYNMSLNGGFNQEKVKPMCAAITALNVQIRQKEDALARVYAKATAALSAPKVLALCACGAEIAADAKFCRSCGADVAAAQGQETVSGLGFSP